MIESINQAGGAGGGVQSVVAGTGISVDNTDPENPIVNSAGIDTDEKAKVSANDTTAGYLNGKLVAGSGIGFTENNNGGNETLTVAVSNLDAGAITTGTIATARLGTGTANSSTYLAGDQTYKAAVTSVNGSTGAVTVAAASHTHAASDITSGVLATARLASSGTASSTTYLRGDQTWASISAGPTFYTVTTADAENTTNEITVISFTVPANTWSSGQAVILEWQTQFRNETGASVSSNIMRVGGTGVTEVSNTNMAFNSTAGLSDPYRFYRLFFVRDGAGMLYPGPSTASQGYATNAFIGTSFISSSSAIDFGNAVTFDSSVDYTVDITMTIKIKLATASANLWMRQRFASAYKIDGAL